MSNTPDAERMNFVHRKVSVNAILIGWFVTIGVFVWNISSTNSNYLYRLERIENELVEMDERLDISETFRIQINTDIAQIKTDLLWIRKTLENPNR